MNSIKIISVGYERRSIDELIAILKTEGVEKLLDIREAPVSRKKGFSKKALAAYLASAHIQYVHLRQAGNPYFKQKHDLVRCLELYAAYLAENPDLVDQIAIEMAGVSAVLCYERRHIDCHRNILLQAIEQAGWVFDLIKVE